MSHESSNAMRIAISPRLAPWCLPLLVAAVGCAGPVRITPVDDAPPPPCGSQFARELVVHNDSREVVSIAALASPGDNVHRVVVGRSLFQLEAGGQQRIKVSGEMVDLCRPGEVVLNLVGDSMTVTIAPPVVQGVAPDIVVDGEDGFRFQGSLSCCENGGDGELVWEPLPGDNVAAVEPLPDRFRCSPQERQQLEVGGRLEDPRRLGTVRLTVRRGDEACSLTTQVSPRLPVRENGSPEG